MSEPLVRGAIVNELGTAFRYANEIANAELRTDGVDPAEYGPLSFIGVMQPVTRTQLAAATGSPRTTVRDMLRAVIERGHAREFPNPRDGRSYLVTLSTKGRATVTKAHAALQRTLEDVHQELEAGSAAAIGEALARFEGALRAAHEARAEQLLRERTN